MRYVRTASVASFEKVVTDLGGDFQTICQNALLPTSAFTQKNYDTFISVVKLSNALFHAATATNCYHIGLILGLKKNSNTLGILGLIAKNTPNLKSAIEAVICNLHIQAQGTVVVNFSYDDKHGILAIGPTSSDRNNSHYISDLILGRTLVYLKSLCGDNFKAIEIRLSARKQGSLSKYKQLLNTKVLINQTYNKIIFPVSYLKMAFENVDPQYNALLRQYKEIEQTNYSTKVTNIIHSILSGNDCNVGYIADQLCLNKRTLNRKLVIEGTTFKELLIKVRKEKSQKMLANTQKTVMQVAMELGYSEPSSFSSAYKSWFGMTPKKYQQLYR